MLEKTTDDLQQELMKTEDLDRFLQENQDSFRMQTVSEIAQEIFSRRGHNKSGVARRAGMSEVYLYQIFSGRRNPTRNKVVCLCIGLCASLEEAQKLLKACGHAPLYVKDPRDAVIIFSLTNGHTLQQTNDALFSHGMDMLT